MKNEKSQFARQIWKKKYANLCRRMQDYKKKIPIYEKKQDKFIKKIYK